MNKTYRSPTDHPERTVKDFGEQWSIYVDNEGFYGSLGLFSDIISPLLKIHEIKDCRVAEIGSGTGRIVNMLLEAGTTHVIAIEPSDAFEVLRLNIRDPAKVTCLRISGDQLPAYGDLDYVFSIGVLHHIPDPKPVIESVYKALRPGGKFFVWLYGKEGNRLYLSLVHPLRVITKHLPHLGLAALVWMLYGPITIYTRLCRRLPLPLREYLLTIFEKMPPDKRRLIIYDQLNPACAKYYTKSEAEKLFLDAKFQNVQIHHRHGYSWTLIGTKPLK
jgi:SAM-dependent methyltransferase